ncbi:hypothetical protein EAE96_002070 [Botrytis aclada]|nr:hypothetical protein EAE96_002070 [Botrytis aclada]
MPYYSQQNSLAYEMPNPDQTWQLFPGEELLIGEVESNTIINPVFDAELMANWQMPIPGQIYLSGETFMENAQLPFHAELTAHHWPAPMANHSMQAPSNEGFLSETPSTHHFLRRPSDTESPANQNHISSSQPISVLPCMRTDRGKRCWNLCHRVKKIRRPPPRHLSSLHLLIHSPVVIPVPIPPALKTSGALLIVSDTSHQFTNAARQIKERTSALLLGVVEAMGEDFVVLTKSMII